MKKTIYIILVSAIVSIFLTIACTIEPVEASQTVNAVNLQGGGKPQYITVQEAQVLIDAAVKAALSANPLVIDGNVNFTNGINSDFGADLGNMEFRNIWYSRRETARDTYSGIKFLEEINSRDWQIGIWGDDGASGMWMDGNGGTSNNNITLTTEGTGSYTKYWQTQFWLMINQTNGIYNLPDIKTFETNEEAKTFFVSKNWSRRGTLYRTPDGTVKATY